MKVYLVIITSIVLQVLAVYLALRLVRVTERVTAWLFIAAAISVMALRRIHALYGVMSGSMTFHSPDVADEVIGLVISILMVAGLFLIGPLFQAINRAAQAIRQSEEKCQILVDNIPAIVFTGYADGTVDFFDNKVEELTGYPEEAFRTRRLKWLELMLSEDLDSARESLVRSLKGKGAYVREYRIKTKAGRNIWIQERSQVTLANDGKIDQINGVFFDITAHKDTEKKLEESEERWRLLLKNSNAIIVILDENAVEKYCSESVEAVTGFRPEEVTGFPAIQRLIHPEDQPHFMEEYYRLVSNPGATMRVQYRHAHKNGGWVWIESLATNLLDDPLVRGVVLNGRDITVRKRAEEALQKSNEQLQTMVAEANQRNQEISLINQMSESLQACLSTKETYSIITRFAQELFPALSGSFFMLDQDKNLLEAISLWGGPLGSARVFASDDCWGIRRGRAHLVEGDGKAMQCRHLYEASSSSYLCLPLIAQGQTLGILHFQGLRKLIPDETDWLQRRAETVAAHVALALTNIRLRETLQHQVIHDPLTGLFNRRYLDETMVREIHRVQRKGAPLGIIMLDLDHFKLFNDTFGHEAGDNLLRALGKFLLTQVRQEDVACRYGGKEFVLIMPEASLDVVKARAEEIREKVPQLQVLHRAQLLKSITVSLGLAIFPGCGATAEDVLQAADDAMYQAKREGRNRVVVAEGSVYARVSGNDNLPGSRIIA